MGSKKILSLLFVSGLAFGQVKPADPPQAGPAPLKYSAPSASGDSSTTIRSPDAVKKNEVTTSVSASKVAVQESKEEGLPREIFEQIIKTQVPFSPKQIREMNAIGDATKKAHAERPRVMPSPISRTLPQNFSSGRVADLIRLFPDFTTSLVFIDSSGAPWNVSRIVVGSKNGIVIPELEGAVAGALKSPTNIITLFPTESYISTSISILLEGAPSPINFILSTGQPSVDLRVDVLLAARGPKTAANVMEVNAPNVSVSNDFSAFIDGVPPKTASPLRTNNSEVRAWIYGSKMIIRTQMEVKSPFVFRRARGADGTSVFEVARSSSVMGVSEGRLVSIGISGFPPPEIEALVKAQNKSQ